MSAPARAWRGRRDDRRIPVTSLADRRWPRPRRVTAAAVAVALTVLGWGTAPALASDPQPAETTATTAGGGAGDGGADSAPTTTASAPPSTEPDSGTAGDGDAPTSTADTTTGTTADTTTDAGTTPVPSVTVTLVPAEPGDTPDVQQIAGGDVDGGSRLHIDQEALLFSLAVEEGPGADGIGAAVEVLQVATGAARGGASLEIRQQAVVATVGRAVTHAGSGQVVEATGVGGTHRLVQTVDAEALGRVDAAVHQLAGLVGIGAGFAGSAEGGGPASAVGTADDLVAGQAALFRTTASVVVEQGTVLASQGTAVATDGGQVVEWVEPVALDEEDAAALVEGVVEAANLVLADQGLRLTFDPEDWTITVEIVSTEHRAEPEPGFTIRQRVTSVVISFRRRDPAALPTGDDGDLDLPWGTSPALAPVAPLVPELHIDLEVPAPAGGGGATAVGSDADVRVCQLVGAATCELPPAEEPATPGPPPPTGGSGQPGLGGHTGGGSPQGGGGTPTPSEPTEPPRSPEPGEGPAGGDEGPAGGGRVEVRTEVVARADGTVVAGAIRVRPLAGPAPATGAAPAALARTGTEPGEPARLGLLLLTTGIGLAAAGRRLARRPAPVVTVAAGARRRPAHARRPAGPGPREVGTGGRHGPPGAIPALRTAAVLAAGAAVGLLERRTRR